jgi:hypothetical protein
MVNPVKKAVVGVPSAGKKPPLVILSQFLECVDQAVGAKIVGMNFAQVVQFGQDCLEPGI